MTDLHAELARHRAALAHLARHDPLTGLGNRRSLGEDLAVLHARSRRYGRGFALAMCDATASRPTTTPTGTRPATRRCVRWPPPSPESFRGGDTVYRYGGEEFVLVLPEQTLDTALVAVERVHSARWSGSPSPARRRP